MTTTTRRRSVIALLCTLTALLALSACNRDAGTPEASTDTTTEVPSTDEANATATAHQGHEGHAAGAATAAPQDDDRDEHPPGCHGHDDEELPATELPGTSIFHLPHTFTPTTGEAIRLSELRGRPSVFVMFYGSCTTACPILFSDARRLEAALPDNVREQVRFVFVTIDPVRDTRESLGAYAANLGLDLERWYLLRGDDTSTRALSAVLGVQYRADGRGHFNHTNRMSVVDADGTVVTTVDGLRQPIDGAVRALTELAAAR